MRWADLPIGRKIGLGFALVLALLLTISVYNYLTISTIHDQSELMMQVSGLEQALTLREIDHLLWSDRLRDLIDSGATGSQFDLELNPEKCKLGLWLAGEERANLGQVIPEAEGLLEELEDHHRHMHGSAESIRSVLASNPEQARRIFNNETRLQLASLRGLLQQTRTELSEYRLAVAEQMDKVTHTAIDRSLLLPVIALVVGILLAFLIARSIVRPISMLTSTMVRAAEGDLDVSVDYQSKDEPGLMVKAFNKMVENIKDVVAASKKAVSETVAASQTMSAASEELSASVDQVASSATQFANSAMEISEQTHMINEAAQQTGELARSGSQKIESCMESMLTIKKSSEETTAAINNLKDASQEIVKIVQVVTNIADQTNLLSLNAAIEAARAGEHGHGFAVVADEVRQLAEQTKSSLREINNLVANLDAQMNSAVESTNASRERVSEGAATVKETTDSLNTIVDQITGIMDQLRTIAEKTQEQAATSEEIAAMTEQQSAATQEIAHSSQDLATIAQELEDIIEKLSVGEQ